MALGYRQPQGTLLHYSDRGPQHTSDDFRDVLKHERVRRLNNKTREEAKADIFDYIERFYNRTRSHSYLGYLSPVQYETRTSGLD